MIVHALGNTHSMEEPMNTNEKIKKLDVMELWKDPALYIALAAIVLRVIPAIGEWHEQNKDVMIPLYIVLAGHLGIRYKSASAKGKVLETETLMEGQLR